MRARPRARAALSAVRAGSCADAGPALPSAPSRCLPPAWHKLDTEFASEPDVVNPTVRAATRQYVHSWRHMPRDRPVAERALDARSDLTRVGRDRAGNRDRAQPL